MRRVTRQVLASNVVRALRARSDSSTRPWAPPTLQQTLQSHYTMTLRLSLLREENGRDQAVSASLMLSAMATT